MKNFIKDNKGNVEVVERLGFFAVTLAVAALIVIVMANVLLGMRNSNCGVNGGATCTGNVTLDVRSYAYNATDSGLQATNQFSQYLPTIALVLVAAIIIGLIVKYFYFSNKEE